MPGSMPGHVAKGAILAKLDEALNELGATGRRAEFFKRISAQSKGGWAEDLVTVATQILPLDSGEEKHLREDWFDVQSGWWLKQQPIEIVVRLGLIHAIELADGKTPGSGSRGTRHGKVRQLDFYWLCGVHDFEVVSCVSASQVTTILVTPSRPASDRLPGHYTGLEPIFTTRHQSLTPGEELLAKPVEHVEYVRARREE